MNPIALEPILEREPFRPFSIRMSNGTTYEINEPRELGFPRKVTDTLVYFGEDVWVLIDVDSITEIMNP